SLSAARPRWFRRSVSLPGICVLPPHRLACVVRPAPLARTPAIAELPLRPEIRSARRPKAPAKTGTLSTPTDCELLAGAAACALRAVPGEPPLAVLRPRRLREIPAARQTTRKDIFRIDEQQNVCALPASAAACGLRLVPGEPPPAALKPRNPRESP